MRIYLRVLLHVAFIFLSVSNALSQTTTNVSNTSAITITNGTVASTYPSTISVSGVTGVITSMTLTINNFTHPRPDDVDMLLVGPAGQAFVFWSDAGGANSLNAVSNITITFSHAAPGSLPDAITNLSSGTFRPTNHGATADVFPVPAPAGPYYDALPIGNSALTVFNGTNPNGVWSLYVVDDEVSSVNGSISGGWTLSINTAAGVVTPSVTVNQAAGQIDPATSGPINFTALFNEPVTGFTSADVNLSGTAGATTAVITEVAPNNGTRYNIAVSGMTGIGTVIASIPAAAVVNSVDVTNTASTSIDNIVTISPTPVTVTINQAAGQVDPSNSGLVNFTAVFSEPITGFLSTDILLAGTAVPTSVVITEITPLNGTTYNIAVSGMSTTGTVTASIPAGVVMSSTSAPNIASTSTDNTVNYIAPPPLPKITTSYTNSSDINIGTTVSSAIPYPSTISVSGLTGTITNVTLEITGFSHNRPDNVDMLLVGPGGQTLIFWSDAGGNDVLDNVVNQTFTFSDAGANYLPDANLLTTGTYKPTNYESTPDLFQLPAPAGPYYESGPNGTFMFNIFRGTDPNGTWSLYIMNDEGGNNAAVISGWTLNLTTTIPTAGSLIVSEFRLRGPGGANDEFIEIYNPTASDHTVTALSGTGYGIASADGTTRASIPNGTIIKAKQHYLVVGSSYSLANYGGTGAVAGNTSYTTDIPDNMGIAIFNNNTGGASYTLANRFDAVGSASEANTLFKEGTGYPGLGTTDFEFALKRKTYNAVPQDTDDNSIDFEFIDLGTISISPQRLGAPGPENLSSPVARNADLILTRLDQSAAPLDPPNVFRDPTPGLPSTNNEFGTIEFRYRLTNNTGVPITRIRLRLDSITTLPAGSGKADLRALTSSTIILSGVTDATTCSSTGIPSTVPCQVTISGTTVEQPPVQVRGGGINTTLSVGSVFVGAPLAAGASINIRVVFGVMKKGSYSVSFTPEVLPYSAAIGPVPPPEKINGSTDQPPSVTINQASGQADPATSGPINFTVVFSKAITGFTSPDVILGGTAGATTSVISEIFPNNGTTYNVAVSGMTSSGTVTASIPAGVVVTSDNLTNLASTSSDNTVTYSDSPVGATVTINQAILQSDPATTSPVNFMVVFSEAVTGFTSSDISLSGTAGATTAVVTEMAPNNGTIFNIAVSGMTTSGTVIASIPAGGALNSSNVGNLASTSFDNTVTYSPPVGGINVTINQAITQSDPANTSPVNFTVVFSEAVSGFTSSDVILSGTAGATTAVVSQVAPNNGTTYNVAVSGMTNSGTIIATIPAGAAGNPAPMFNNASTSSDNSITYQFNCTIECPANITVTATSSTGATINYNVSASVDCGTITSLPASGTTFPVGTTTVNAYRNFDQKAFILLNGARIASFNISNPLAVGTPITVTGLVAAPGTTGTTVLAAIDFRPSNGVLYGVALTLFPTQFGEFWYKANLFTINTTTGVATQVGTGTYDVFGSQDCSIDFDPVTDELRLVDQLGGNLRINPNTGALIALDANINPSAAINMAGIAYSNNVVGATSSTLYDLNSSTNLLYRQGGIGGTPSANTGTVTAIGSALPDFLPAVGFDISETGIAYAKLEVSGVESLYKINLQTGVATSVSIIGARGIVDMALAPLDIEPSCSFMVTVNPIPPPTITCPANITVNASAGTCDHTVSFTGANEIIVTGTPAPLISYTIAYANGGSAFGNDQSSFPSTLTFPLGVSTINITATNGGGSVSCSFTVKVVDNQPPVLICPANITVNAAIGQCTASVRYVINGSENCSNTIQPMTIVTSAGLNASLSGLLSPFSVSQTKEFPVGTTLVNVLATDAAGNTATCSFNVIVHDTEKPVITSSPPAITVECTSQIPAANISLVAATDNCGAPTISHVGDVISSQTCTNKYTITRTYRATDGSGNQATVAQLITVDDITPPQITGLTPSKLILAPPNHKMVAITLDYTVSDNCLSDPNVSISISSSEPVNGTGDGDTDPDWEVIDDHHIRLRAERSAQGTGRIYTITVTVDDGCNAPVSETTEVRVTHNITGPQSGNSFRVGSTVAFTGEFWDVPGNTHTAKWLIDGTTTAKGLVVEPSGNKNGKVVGSYKFTAPGVYKLQMNITDQKGVTTFANTNGDVDAIVVIYDPNGGYTYGGGYYDSPKGALLSNPSSGGKASYGFTMNYFKNATNPKGETQFEFKVGEFEFNALNFEYLVISNSMAQFKGTGKIIGGQSGIGFIMTVVDGQLDGSGVDKIRMKIYNKNNGKVIYDNQPGASDAALPVQAVGANSTVVINGTNSSQSPVYTNQIKTEAEATAPVISNALDVIAYPNPSRGDFTINVKGNSSSEKVVMQVIDIYGRVIETRNVNASSIIKIGDDYSAGTYVIRVFQGKEHKEIKLVKLN